MAPGHEIAFRAVGTALAGMSIAFAVYMLAYGGGKTRINGMEHLAIFAQPRGSAGAALPAELPPRRLQPARRRRHGDDGFVRRFRPARPRRSAAGRDRRRPSGSRLAEDRRRAPLGRSRRQRAGRRPHRRDCRARRRLGLARRQGRDAPCRRKRRERRPRSSPARGSSNDPAASSSLGEFAPRLDRRACWRSRRGRLRDRALRAVGGRDDCARRNCASGDAS